jgi:hypothetical protein
MRAPPWTCPAEFVHVSDLLVSGQRGAWLKAADIIDVWSTKVDRLPAGKNIHVSI